MTDTAVETPAVSADEATEVEAKPAKVVKTPSPCACSFYTGTDAKGNALDTECEAVTVRTFGPGHDAKLKSLLIKVAIAGGQVTKTTDEDGEVDLEPTHAAEEYGFRTQVEKGLAVHQAKLDASAEKKRVRDEKAEVRKAEKEKAKAERKAVQDQRKADAAAKAEAEKAANESKTPGPARAKVGRTEFDGEVLADGTFRYEKDGEQVETEKYTIVVSA